MSELRTFLTIALLFISRLVAGAALVDDYGLNFHSYDHPGPERSSLMLDDGNPFVIGDSLCISFNLLVRESETPFGPILVLDFPNDERVDLSLLDTQTKISLGIIVGNNLQIIDNDIRSGEHLNVQVCINSSANLIKYDICGERAQISIPIDPADGVKISFGRKFDVAPINVSDVNIFSDGNHIRSWQLRLHDGNICYDSIAGSIARANNPEWIIDRHLHFSEIYDYNFIENVDLVYNPDDDVFYIVTLSQVITLSPSGIVIDTTPIKGGHPAELIMSQLVWHPVLKKIVSYSTDNNDTSIFDFATGRWSQDLEISREPSSYLHATGYNEQDSTFWFFGGYGLHRFNNHLWRSKLDGSAIERIDYSPSITPRVDASGAVVNNKLYIFGGQGNESGMQALPIEWLYDFYEIDLNTLESKKLWSGDCDGMNDMAQQLIFDPVDSVLYAMPTHGGNIVRLTLDGEVSDTNTSIHFSDTPPATGSCVNFFVSGDGKRWYVTRNLILFDGTHNINISYINPPLLPSADVQQHVDATESSLNPWIWALLFVAALAAALTFFILGRTKQPHDGDLTTTTPEGNDTPDTSQQAPFGTPADSPDDLIEPTDVEDEEDLVEVAPTFEFPKASAIYLLGTFSAINAAGEDITKKFTSRMQQLLLMVYLYTIHNGKGANQDRIAEELWSDKDIFHSRKNRNVTLTRLRPLLAEIGSYELKNAENYVSLTLGDDIFCDYQRIKDLFSRYENGDNSPEVIDEIIALISQGALLSWTKYDWLDKFKEEFSMQTIEILNRILNNEYNNGRYDTAIRVASAILAHEDLNEEAITLKCIILIRTGHTQFARNQYDKFCYEYRRSMGDDFETSFSDILRAAKD